MRLQDLLYAALNPPMRALLRSPLHGIASRNLAILCYRGRKSGREYATPLSYVKDQTRENGTPRERVRFLSSRNTRWWLNFRGGPIPVEIEIARELVTGEGRLLTTDPRDGVEREVFLGGVREFLTALPRDAVIYGVGLDKNRRPKESDLQSAADHIILVEVLLG
jgi:hypothetical protein